MKNGRSLIGISAAQRNAAGIELGDDVEIELSLDTEPRVVDEPSDVAAALDTDDELRRAFEALPFGLRRKHINHIESAKTTETRRRRIQRLLDDLG